MSSRLKETEFEMSGNHYDEKNAQIGIATFEMTANRRIFLNIISTYGRLLYALVIGLLCER